MCTVRQEFIFFKDFLVEIDPAKHKARGYVFFISAPTSCAIYSYTVFTSPTFKEILHYIKWPNRDTEKQRAAISSSACPA